MTDDRAPRPTPAEATVEAMNELGAGRLPGVLGVTVTSISEGAIAAEMEVTPAVLAPNGYLHAASVVALADTACGLGCRVTLPAGASGFTTLEQKTSYLGTTRSGRVHTVATLAHGGRRTQVWDAEVFDDDGRRIALFRCTQLVLWPAAGEGRLP